MEEVLPRKSVSAIVPIFNEEASVSKVIDVLLECAGVDEIICVDDGSTDKSQKILSHYGNLIKVIYFKRNHGKGFALSAGIKKAKGEIVLFIDADLQNLTRKHIEKLLKPILHSSDKAVIGVRSSERLNLLVHRFNIAGERAYHRRLLLPYLNRMRKSRYGVEVLLNTLFSKKQTKIVVLKGVYNPPKHKKRGLDAGIREYLKETFEITRELARIEGKPIENYFTKVSLNRIKNTAHLKKVVETVSAKYSKTFIRKYFSRYMRTMQSFFSSL